MTSAQVVMQKNNVMRGAGSCRGRSHSMDKSAEHECKFVREWLDAGYHLRVPGSCRL
jgi:hypothetical protein